MRKLQSRSNRSRFVKRVLRRTLADSVIVSLAYIAALAICRVPLDTLNWKTTGPIVIGAYLICNAVLGFYNRLWGYGGSSEPLLILIATGTAMVLLIAAALLRLKFVALDVSTVIIGGHVTFVGFVMLRYRHLIRHDLKHLIARPARPEQIRVLIVGTNPEARQVARRLHYDNLGRYTVVGFVDDNHDCLRMLVEKWAVIGQPAEIAQIVSNERIDVILIAEQKIDGLNLNQLLNMCQETPAQIKILPTGIQILNNRQWDLSTLRDVTVDDLLGRETVQVDEIQCDQIITGRVILVTGASGSIGSELCRQICHFAPARLVMVDNNESALHDLIIELSRDPDHPQLKYVLGDITHGAKMKRLFATERPNVVFHAAAYKHVPMLEIHPEEAVRVNILGTLILSECAARYETERFVFISTDKAVNPSSVMGASKRIGELWLAALNQIAAKTIFTSVRFGNVIASRGSVINIFKRQIEWGGPVTVTHPEMTRYFMSIPEAVSLVLHAITLSRDFDIFMLEMGEQISVLDLAKRMIRLRGLRVGSDIEIKFTGIRPGEKLHEELSYDNEVRNRTSHPKIYRLGSRKTLPDLKDLLGCLAVLIEAAQHHQMNGRLRSALLAAARADMDECLRLVADLDFLARPAKRSRPPERTLTDRQTRLALQPGE